MMTPTGRESAKIIPFPSRQPAAARDARPSALAAALALDELRARQIPVCDFGSGWYHDAAMQEEAPGRKA